MKMWKKIIRIIEKNSSFITIISTILFSVLTIFSSLYISNVQNKIQKEGNAPVFFLKENENGTIEILNKGGMVSYFKFKRVTELYISVNNKMISLDIYYYDKNRLENISANIDNENLWYYVPVINNITEEEIKKIIDDKIEEIYPKEIRVFVEIKDYYVLSCKDYENSYREFHYTINDNGVGEPYDYVKKDLKEESLVSAGGMPSYGYATKEDFYAYFEESIASTLLYFRWYFR